MILAALAVGSLPAVSAPAHADVTVGDNISVFPNRDMVAVMGYDEGDELVIEVLRNNVVIGRTAGVAAVTPEGVGLEVNHGPEGTPAPGDCWDGVTPDIRGGDMVRVTSPDGVDTMTVAKINFLGGPRLSDDGSSVFIEGQASALDGTRLVGDPFSVEVRNDAVDPRVRADELPWDYLDDTGNIWRATFTSDDRERDAALAGTWIAVVGTEDGPETTLAEFGESEGPAPGCDSPAEPNSLTAGYQQPINLESGDVLLSGTARQNVTGVSVRVADLEPQVADIVTDSAGEKTWTVTLAKATLSQLPDGSIVVQPTFFSEDVPEGTPGTPRTMVKDTVAPAGPTASPAPGIYPVAQSITLAKPPGELQSKIHWAIGDATVVDPDASSAVYGSQIHVTSSQTIKARLIDAAGNRGEVATFAYTIGSTTTPPATGGGTDPGTPPAGGGGGTDPGTPPAGGGGGTDPGTPPGDGGTDPGTPPVGGGGGTDPGTPPTENPPVTRTVVVEASADTMLRRHMPRRSAASASRLFVDERRTASRASRATGYLRFVLPELGDEESITGGRLSLRVLEGTGDGPVVWRTGTGWSEQMTWLRRPPRRGNAPVGDFDAMPVGRVSTAVVVPAGRAVSFELFAESANGVTVASSERRGALRPRLILSITRK